MPSRYRTELGRLDGVYQAALEMDVTPLATVCRALGRTADVDGRIRRLVLGGDVCG